MQATLYGRCHQILGEETNFRDEGGASMEGENDDGKERERGGRTMEGEGSS